MTGFYNMHIDNIIYYSTALLPVKADLENNRLREKISWKVILKAFYETSDP